MVKNHSDNERGNPHPTLHRLLTVISYAHRSTDMIAHAVFFVASLVEEMKLILWHIVNLVSSCSLLILIGTVTIGERVVAPC